MNEEGAAEEEKREEEKREEEKVAAYRQKNLFFVSQRAVIDNSRKRSGGHSVTANYMRWHSLDTDDIISAIRTFCAITTLE